MIDDKQREFDNAVWADEKPVYLPAWLAYTIATLGAIGLVAVVAGIVAITLRFTVGACF